jgi:hypothetical protein
VATCRSMSTILSPGDRRSRGGLSR